MLKCPVHAVLKAPCREPPPSHLASETSKFALLEKCRKDVFDKLFGVFDDDRSTIERPRNDFIIVPAYENIHDLQECTRGTPSEKMGRWFVFINP
jgi:hypothetical protein